MQEILFDYKLNPTTWAYISALMLVGIYFKFRRFWSVRNLDLVALIAFSPGLLLVYYGLSKQTPDWIRAGYVWLYAMGAFFLIRLLLDPVMVRRPLLEPNLSASGLTFTGVALLVFLMANVITSPPERLERLLAKQETPAHASPGCDFFYTFAGYSNQPIAPIDEAHPEVYRQTLIRVTTTRAVAIVAHLAVLLGMIWIGFRHFDNIHTGVAAATLYLLTFYTSQFTSQVDHVAPAALLVWAVAAYRRPTDFRNAVGPGGRHDLLSAVPAAALVRVLLAAGTDSLQPRRDRRDSNRGGRAGPDFPRPGSLGAAVETDVRLAESAGGPPLRLLGILRIGIPNTRAGGVCGHVRRIGHLAGAKESRHAAKLFRRRDAGHAVLARPLRRTIHGLVPAAVDPDHLPAEPGRPRGPFGRAAGVEKKGLSRQSRPQFFVRRLKRTASDSLRNRVLSLSWRRATPAVSFGRRTSISRPACRN